MKGIFHVGKIKAHSKVRKKSRETNVLQKYIRITRSKLIPRSYVNKFEQQQKLQPDSIRSVGSRECPRVAHCKSIVGQRFRSRSRLRSRSRAARTKTRLDAPSNPKPFRYSLFCSIPLRTRYPILYPIVTAWRAPNAERASTTKGIGFAFYY